MDYRNGDGSIAEMCGNGVRVFARYLQRAGLAEAGDLAVATRGGVKQVHIAKDGRRSTGADHVGMGARCSPEGDVTVTRRRAQLARPQREHGQSARGRLRRRPRARRGPVRAARRSAPPPPTRTASTSSSSSTAGPRHVAMRVHERGSGETRSCGTGACAVVVAAARRDGADPAVTGAPSRTPSTCPAGAW